MDPQYLSFEYEAMRGVPREEVLKSAVKWLCQLVGVEKLPDDVDLSIRWEWTEGNTEGYQVELERYFHHKETDEHPDDVIDHPDDPCLPEMYPG